MNNLDSFLLERVEKKILVDLFKYFRSDVAYFYLRYEHITLFKDRDEVVDRITSSDLEEVVSVEHTQEFELLDRYKNECCLIKIPLCRWDTFVFYLSHISDIGCDLILFSEDLEVSELKKICAEFDLDLLVEQPNSSMCLDKVRKVSNYSYWHLFPDPDMWKSTIISRNSVTFAKVRTFVVSKFEVNFVNRDERNQSQLLYKPCSYPVSIVKEVERFKSVTGIGDAGK